MKHFHYIKLTVFVKEGEDEQRIAERLRALVPFDLEAENIVIEQTRATGALDNPIVILSITLTKPKHTNAFLERLLDSLTAEQKTLLLQQAPTRLDAECNFFIRFDKNAWLENTLQVTDSGNCFHIKMNLAVYPVNWEGGLAMIQRMLEKG